MPRRSSSGSEDSDYTRALLLHQRARMERLMKELEAAGRTLGELKEAVAIMEYEALQRRFRRAASTTPTTPDPEEMSRLRALNRKLQMDIESTLKEIDSLVPTGGRSPKPSRREEQQPTPSPPAPRREEDFEGAPWTCDICTFLNHPALHRCEECDMLRRYT